jgi:hypothetical protein
MILILLVIQLPKILLLFLVIEEAYLTIISNEKLQNISNPVNFVEIVQYEG